MNAFNAGALARTLAEWRDYAILFRTLATLRTDIRLFTDVEELRWKGPTAAFATVLNSDELARFAIRGYSAPRE